ncbi:hypothetical protein V6N12_069176 [Hibiscus sabdariffa]|uniref:Uncharacterized protein n=1 Tax=Hibiscus sabdariffa TaxID=183260 RepID=A0ABR2FD18_9ROSI
MGNLPQWPDPPFPPPAPIVDKDMVFPIMVQEAKLVRVPAVEQCSFFDGTTLGEHSQEASMTSPWVNSPVEHDRAVADCDSLEESVRVIGVNGESSSSTTIVGLVGATVAPVIGTAQGGARKVKSVNTLVEDLGSPA